MTGVKKKYPLVSVVVLNWNRATDTLACIDSVKNSTYKKTEIILVDNGSKPSDKEILSRLKGISFIDNEANRGFTGGHIDGLRHANGDYIFVLNNDAVMDPHYIENAISILQNDPAIAVVGGRSYHWTEDSGVFEDSVPYYAFQRINPVSLEGIFDLSDAGFDHEVNWVSGSAMVLRRRALETCGYFYEPFFAYYEESDLFARIQACGFKIVYSPALKIWHKDGASSSSYFQLYQLFRNRFMYAVRNLRLNELPRFIVSYLHTTMRGLYYRLFGNNEPDSSKTMYRAQSNALFNTLIMWPKWLLSRRGVAHRDPGGYTLVQRLGAEQVGISFVCDLSEGLSNLESVLDFAKKVTYAHYNSEIVIVCKKTDHKQLAKHLAKLDATYNIKPVINVGIINTSPLNLGWLSASKHYVWFISSSYQPAINKVEEACVELGVNDRAIYIDKPVSDSRDGIVTIELSQNTCVSRDLLAAYGGVGGDTLQSLVGLYCFSKQLHNTRVAESRLPKTAAFTHPISDDERVHIRLLLNSMRGQKRVGSPYHKLLERHYRLYQINNICAWLFVRDIPLRLKFARIRNLLSSIIRLDRHILALELKHIANEVVKARHTGFNKETREQELYARAREATHNQNWQQTPVFVICRDRLSPLRQLVSWLESAGMTNIIFIDNDSAYKPLLEYYNSTPYQVIRTGKNIGHTVVWSEGMAKALFPNQYYIVTDPDVIPDEACPKNAVANFYELHCKYSDYQKVGFGLQIDDLPDHYKLKSHVIEWESQFWKEELEPGVYEAGVDTTFALYKPYTDFYMLHPSIRTGRPYTARHLPWYVDSEKIDPEEAFYRMHARQDVTSWNSDELLERYKKEMRS